MNTFQIQPTLDNTGKPLQAHYPPFGDTESVITDYFEIKDKELIILALEVGHRKEIYK